MSMKRRQRQAIILTLAGSMRDHGSWCGETHLQKAAYFIEELTQVPLELEFILYKHGPFSFELRDELTAMRADGLIEMCAKPYPYGPALLTTDSGKKMMARWPKTLNRHNESIEFVARQLGGLGVTELERLATALYVTKEKLGMNADVRAQRIHELKPHVSVEEAKVAIEAVDKMSKECPRTAA